MDDFFILQHPKAINHFYRILQKSMSAIRGARISVRFVLKLSKVFSTITKSSATTYSTV